jgi:hypothetical protein
VNNTKLTRREVLHFITTAITTEEDGSEEEEERGPKEGIEDAPRGQRRCTMSGFGPSDQPLAARKDPGKPASHPFNPRNTPPSGCVMIAAQ